MFYSRSIKNPFEEASRVRSVRRAKAIISLEETEGWKHFVETVEELIQSYTPDVESFTPEKATEIASKMAFISGARRCLGLIEQQKSILASNKRPEDE